MIPADETPRVVVLGWGNITRSDDGLGPLLMERVREARLPHVTAIEDFQLQVEHALDLQGQELALFVDAGQGTPAPFSFAQTAARMDLTFTSHKQSPEAVLSVYETIVGKAPPPAFVLTVAGEDFSVGALLSPAGAQRLELAWDFLLGLLRAPSLEGWREAAGCAGAVWEKGAIADCDAGDTMIGSGSKPEC
jgi:hydrogenase maturation protease